MTPYEKKTRLENLLKKKEIEAQEAKAKGMRTMYSNRLEEITELKKELRKLSMGQKTTV